jgi:hypothetical protein
VDTTVWALLQGKKWNRQCWCMPVTPFPSPSDLDLRALFSLRWSMLLPPDPNFFPPSASSQRLCWSSLALVLTTCSLPLVSILTCVLFQHDNSPIAWHTARHHGATPHRLLLLPSMLLFIKIRSCRLHCLASAFQPSWTQISCS